MQIEHGSFISTVTTHTKVEKMENKYIFIQQTF